MAGDLGMGKAQVHDEARAVLDFWFGLTDEQHFAKDEALDREIARRFGGLRDAVLATGARDWHSDPDTLLTAVILLDQFSRNIFWGTARAYEGDDLARRIVGHAVQERYDVDMPADRRVFLYMPFMHAEDLALQDLSVARFEALGIEENLKFAQAHRHTIARFGRFPGRNAALRRTSTPDEERWLKENDGGW